jgi:hypothetical protein
VFAVPSAPSGSSVPGCSRHSLPADSSSPHELVRFFKALYLCGPLFNDRFLRMSHRHGLPLLGFCAPPPLSPANVLSTQLQAADFDAPPPSDTQARPVVLHHLDGLLHSLASRLVSSWSRSWGSPRFPEVSLVHLHRSAYDRLGLSPVSRSAGSHPPKNSTHMQPYRIAAAFAFLSLLHKLLPASHLDRSRCDTPSHAEALELERVRSQINSKLLIRRSALRPDVSDSSTRRLSAARLGTLCLTF